jgi:dephospho-CoA kinase
VLAGFVGATGVGKSTLTYKLQKMGYHVHFEGFVEMYVRQPALHVSLALQRKETGGVAHA